MMNKHLTAIVAMAVMILGLASGARAQGTGSILGTVKDLTDAVLPGATAAIKQTDTGLTREVTPDVRGRYAEPNFTTLASAPRQAQLGVKLVW